MSETGLKSLNRDGNLEIEVPGFDLYEVVKVETK